MSESVTLSQEDIDQLVDSICGTGWIGYGGMSLRFEIKANRDAVYYAAKKKGAILKRGSTGHSLLDPRYTVEGRNLPDKGMANDLNSYWKLYKLERVG